MIDAGAAQFARVLFVLVFISMARFTTRKLTRLEVWSLLGCNGSLKR